MTSSPFPSGAITSVSGRTVVLRGNDIDTDRIIPARFLKCVTFDGLGAQVFADDRSEQDGQHPFDLSEHQGAAILIVNRNFGCGSSREHAPQALMRWGIRAVVGESFAEIFYGNCLAIGIPCLQVSSEEIDALQSVAEAAPQTNASISLEPPAIAIDGQSWQLGLAADAKNRLLGGQWDATSQLLQQEQELQATASRLPYLQGFVASP
jgi:3-isopropylmalate/(R)-2-methylmalate dehydratase small subunit